MKSSNAYDVIYKMLLDDPQTPIAEIVKALSKKGHIVTDGYVGTARRNFLGITEFLRNHGALAANPTAPVEAPKPSRRSRRKAAETETDKDAPVEQPQADQAITQPIETTEAA